MTLLVILKKSFDFLTEGFSFYFSLFFCLNIFPITLIDFSSLLLQRGQNILPTSGFQEYFFPQNGHVFHIGTIVISIPPLSFQTSYLFCFQNSSEATTYNNVLALVPAIYKNFEKFSGRIASTSTKITTFASKPLNP